MSETCGECGRPYPDAKTRARTAEIEREVEEFIYLRRRGLGSKEACEKIGVKYSTMIDRLTKRGLKTNGKPRSQYWGQGRYPAIVEDFDELRLEHPHAPQIAIAAMLGISAETLRRALKKADRNYDW